MIVNFFLWLLLIIVVANSALIGMWGISSLIGAYYGAPMVSSSKKIAKLLSDNINLEKGDIILDIGCGIGGFLIPTLKQEPSIKAIGVDISKYFLIITRIRSIFSRSSNRLTLRKMKLENIHLLPEKDKIKVIYLYLLPNLLQKSKKYLIENFSEEVIVITNGFSFFEKDKKRYSNGKEGLYIYTIKELKI